MLITFSPTSKWPCSCMIMDRKQTCLQLISPKIKQRKLNQSGWKKKTLHVRGQMSFLIAQSLQCVYIDCSWGGYVFFFVFVCLTGFHKYYVKDLNNTWWQDEGWVKGELIKIGCRFIWRGTCRDFNHPLKFDAGTTQLMTMTHTTVHLSFVFKSLQ